MAVQKLISCVPEQVACTIAVLRYSSFKEGTNVLVGEDPQQLQEALQQLAQGTWKEGHLPDRWDGRSAERILRILSEEIQKHH